VEELLQFMVEELSCGREEAILALVAASGAVNMAKASNNPDFSREIIETTHRNLILLWQTRCADRVEKKPKVMKTTAGRRRIKAG
jgi:hypothetical protein